MTMHEFREFEKKTYEILEKIKPLLKDYIRTWSPLDIRTVKNTADEYVRSGTEIILPDEFDDNLFNFITDNEFALWIEQEKIGIAFERTDWVIQKPPKEDK